jgi:hypothetical protein
VNRGTTSLLLLTKWVLDVFVGKRQATRGSRARSTSDLTMNLFWNAALRRLGTETSTTCCRLKAAFRVQGFKARNKFPPQPSPPGEGGAYAAALEFPRTDLSKAAFEIHGAYNGRSLSLGERVKVRASVKPFFVALLLLTH